MADVLSRAMVSLTVLSTQQTPEALAERIGVAADCSWRLGDQRSPRSRSFHQFSGVAYDSHLRSDAPVREQIDDILERLADNWERLESLAEAIRLGEGPRSSLKLRITRQLGTIKTGFDVDASQLARLASIGADIAVDVDVLDPAPRVAVS